MALFRAPVLTLVSALLALGPLRAGTVRTLDGEIFRGNTTLTANGSVQVVATIGGETTAVELGRILVAQFREETPGSAPPETRGALLLDGSFASGRVVSEREASAYKIEGRTAVRVEAAQIARLVFRPIPPGIDTAGKTGVLLANGDFAAGKVTRLDKDRVEISSLLFGTQTFRLPEEAAGVVLAPLKPSPAAFEVVTTDGSVYRASRLEVDGDQLALETALLGKIKVRLAELDRIRAGEGRFRSLTQLGPASVQTLPGADGAAAFRAVLDPAHPGPPVAGRRPDNALLIAAGSSATFAVPAGLDFISAEVAVPDDTPAGVRVVFVVAADGRVLHRSPALSAGARPAPVRVKLGPVRSLVLFSEPVGPPAKGVVGVWTDPVLLKR